MNPLWRILYRSYRAGSALKRWLARRLAQPGRVVMTGLLLTAVVGLDTENSVTYQGFALLFFLMAVAAGFSWFFKVRLTARRVLPRFATAGQPLEYTVVLKNLTRRSQAGLVLLENVADPRPGFAEWRAAQLADEKLVRSFQFAKRRRDNPFRVAVVKEADIPAVLPGQETEVRLQITPLRRGLLRFTGLTVARADPFGLFRAFTGLRAPQSLLVLPRRYRVANPALPGALKYQQGGVAFASNVGQSEEFVALRDYRRGDPVRHIHWRSWARTGKPIVKEFEDEFFVRHALILDTFIDEPRSEVFEEAVSVAASFACALQSQESLLDLLFIGAQAFCFTSGRGLAHADQMLEILASVQPAAAGKFDSLEHLVLGHLGAVSGCICVLLEWDEARRRLVERIQGFGVPVSVFLIRPRGGSGNVEPGPMRTDPARFRILEAGRVEQELARA